MASSGQWPGGQRDGPGGPSSTAWASVSEAQLPSPRSSPWRNHLRLPGWSCRSPSRAGPSRASSNGCSGRPHPACPVLHPATCRKLLDGEPLSSDSSGHRAARMASDVIESSTRERRSEEHTSELQSRGHLVCRLLLEKKK